MSEIPILKKNPKPPKKDRPIPKNQLDDDFLETSYIQTKSNIIFDKSQELDQETEQVKIVDDQQPLLKFKADAQSTITVYSASGQKNQIPCTKIKTTKKSQGEFLKIEDLYTSYLKSNNQQYKDFVLNMLSFATNLDTDIFNHIWENKIYTPFFQNSNTTSSKSETKIKIVNNKILIKSLYLELIFKIDNLILFPFGNITPPIILDDTIPNNYNITLFISKNGSDEVLHKFISSYKSNKEFNVIDELRTLFHKYKILDFSDKIEELFLNNISILSELNILEFKGEIFNFVNVSKSDSMEYKEKFYKIFIDNEEKKEECFRKIIEDYESDVSINLNGKNKLIFDEFFISFIKGEKNNMNKSSIIEFIAKIFGDELYQDDNYFTKVCDICIRERRKMAELVFSLENNYKSDVLNFLNNEKGYKFVNFDINQIITDSIVFFNNFKKTYNERNSKIMLVIYELLNKSEHSENIFKELKQKYSDFNNSKKEEDPVDISIFKLKGEVKGCTIIFVMTEEIKKCINSSVFSIFKMC